MTWLTFIRDDDTRDVQVKVADGLWSLSTFDGSSLVELDAKPVDTLLVMEKIGIDRTMDPAGELLKICGLVGLFLLTVIGELEFPRGF